MSQTHQKLLTKVINGYQFDKLLALGTFSKVYQARQLKTNSSYAIKAFPKSLLKGNPLFNQLLKYETKILQNSKSENLIKFFGKFQSEETLFFVTELCNEGSLEQKLIKNNRLPYSQVTEIIKQVVEAFNHLHNMRAIHRDLKPVHILFHNGIVKLCGFTFSRVFAENQPMEDSISLGTAFYMSPEALKCQRYGIQTDVWSLGVITYKMLCGELPFTGNGDQEILACIEKENLCYSDGLSPQCSDFLKKCLVVTKKNRMTWQQLSSHEFIAKLSIQKTLQCSSQRIKYIVPKIILFDPRSTYKKNVKLMLEKVYSKFMSQYGVLLFTEQEQKTIEILDDFLKEALKQLDNVYFPPIQKKMQGKKSHEKSPQKHCLID